MAMSKSFGDRVLIFFLWDSFLTRKPFLTTGLKATNRKSQAVRDVRLAF